MSPEYYDVVEARRLMEDRQGSLKRELAELLPQQPRGHDLAARIKATTSVAGVAAAARKEDMEHLKDSLTSRVLHRPARVG